MADIVNLKRARKARARAEAEAVASANRAKFGRPKAERARDGAETERAARSHAAHRIAPDDDKGETT